MSGNKIETDKLSGSIILQNTDYDLYYKWRYDLNTQIARKPGLTGQLQAAGVVTVEQSLKQNIDETKETKSKQKRQKEIKEMVDNRTVTEGTQEYEQLNVEWRSLGTPEQLTASIKELKDEFDKLNKELDRVTNNTKDIFETIEKTTDSVLRAIAVKAEKDHEDDKAMGLKTALDEIEKRMKGHPTEIQARIKAKLGKATPFKNCTELQNLVNQLDMIKKEMVSHAKESKIEPDIKDSEMIKILRDQYKLMSKEDKSALPVTIRSTLEGLDPSTDNWDGKTEIIRKQLINPITDEKEAEKDRLEEKKNKQETKQESVAFAATTGGKDRARRPPGSDSRPCRFGTESNCPFGQECEYQHESDNQTRGDRYSSQERGSRRSRSRDRGRSGGDRYKSQDRGSTRDNSGSDRDRGRDRDRDRGGDRDKNRDRSRSRDREDRRGRDRERDRSRSTDTAKNQTPNKGTGERSATMSKRT